MSCQPSVIQSSDFLSPSERSRIAAKSRLSERDFIRIPATRSGATFCKEVEFPEPGCLRLSGKGHLNDPRRRRDHSGGQTAMQQACFSRWTTEAGCFLAQ